MGLLSTTVLEIVAATTSPGLALAMQTTPPTPVVVDVRYRAPAGCPSENWFYSEVLRRVPHARRAESDESARRFDVDVDVDVTGNESRASLEFVDVEGRRVERELHAENCAEVVAGIAVVTAVAIDPRLAELERKAEAPSTPPPPKPEPPKPIEREPPKRTAAWALGAHAGAVSDTAPIWAPSAEVFTELVSPPTLAGRFSFGFADSGEFERDGATLRFWLLQGRLVLCPFPLELGTRLRVLPCVGFEAGAAHAESRESPRVVEPMGTTGIWLAGALTPSVELDVAGPFFLELGGLVRVPVLSRTYVLERPETVTYETPAVGFGAFLGFGARFGY